LLVEELSNDLFILVFGLKTNFFYVFCYFILSKVGEKGGFGIGDKILCAVSTFLAGWT